MKNKVACITLDLEAFGWNDDPASSPELNDFELHNELMQMIHKHSIPLTVFAVGNLLPTVPRVIDFYEKHGVEFELHSHTHNIMDTDGREEVEKAFRVYKERFGRSPRGYRAPWGKISSEGVARLEKLGFLYDSSVYPSRRPGVFDFTDRPFFPHRWEGNGIWELPLAVIPTLRLPLAMSYLKFFGLWTYRALFKLFGLSNPCVFIIHPQDFVVSKASLERSHLPRWIKFYHKRNMRHSFKIFDDFLVYLKNNHYQFLYMSEIYDRFNVKPETQKTGGPKSPIPPPKP
jgi:hypothetical protein